MELIGILATLGILICIVMLIVAVVRKKPKRQWGVGLAICFILLMAAFMPTSTDSTQAELDSLKQLYEKTQVQIADLETENSKLITENKELSDQKAELESQLAEKTSALEAALVDLEKLSTQTGSPAPSNSSSNSTSNDSSGSESMVYIPKTGSKYHRTSTCSNMKNPNQVTKSQAISMGYGRCSKCW